VLRRARAPRRSSRCLSAPGLGVEEAAAARAHERLPAEILVDEAVVRFDGERLLGEVGDQRRLFENRPAVREILALLVPDEHLVAGPA
jgi:hypothetical protein